MSVLSEIKKKGAKTVSTQRKVAFDYLLEVSDISDDVMVGDFYLFEYNPKFKAFLKQWDKYPLVLVLNVYDDGFLGANLHYTTQKQRILLAKKYLNKNIKIPPKLLHRYIFAKADNLFFKVRDKDLMDYAALTLEEFRDNKNRFISAAKVQKSGKL